MQRPMQHILLTPDDFTSIFAREANPKELSESRT